MQEIYYFFRTRIVAIWPLDKNPSRTLGYLLLSIPYKNFFGVNDESYRSAPPAMIEV